MSQVYGDIFGAIYNKYANTSALNTLTHSTTSMFSVRAEVGDDMPYIIVSIPSYAVMTEFAELPTPLVNMRVRFGLYDKSLNRGNLDQMLDKLEAAYGSNGSGLTFEDSTYQFVCMTQEMITDGSGDGVWIAHADYMLALKKL